jgi:Matrixin
MVKRLIVGMIAGLALAALGTHLNAYVFSGHRWPGNSVPFYVNPVNQDVTQSAAITALQVAASNWKNQSTADINIYYAGTTTGGTIANNGKNEIFFRNESNGSTGAVTYWWYGGDGKLMDADMMFYDAGFKFFTGQSGCSSGIYIEDLATHEFGHFLGINHSGDTTATMYPTISAWCNQSWRFLAQDQLRSALGADGHRRGARRDQPASECDLDRRLEQRDRFPSGAIDGRRQLHHRWPARNEHSLVPGPVDRVQHRVQVSRACGQRQRRLRRLEHRVGSDAGRDDDRASSSKAV